MLTVCTICHINTDISKFVFSHFVLVFTILSHFSLFLAIELGLNFNLRGWPMEKKELSERIELQSERHTDAKLTLEYETHKKCHCMNENKTWQRATS